MKNVGPIRKQMGVPTVFNVLGPLTNPAQPDNQVSTFCTCAPTCNAYL